MFLPTDYYTVSPGNFKIYNCWTDKVSKFDTSSFYNWEQDNLPVYDLEERTYYLWEKLGFPTSSIPGISLVVSADASDQDIGCNKNIFRTIEDAIESLPEVINFPIIIEVCNFGKNGEIVLNNLKFGKTGSLEIINRNFSRQEYSVSSSFNVTGNLGGLDVDQDDSQHLVPPYLAQFEETINGLSRFSPSSMIDKGAAYPVDNYNVKIEAQNGFFDASCMALSCAIFSATDDVRFTTSPYPLNGYASRSKIRGNYNLGTLVIDDKQSVNPLNGLDDTFIIKNYEAVGGESFDQISSKDFSLYDFMSNASVGLYGDLLNSYPFNANNAGQRFASNFNGLFYGNKFTKAVINNCDGPIYLRNFFFDGSGAYKTDNLHGVTVNNCAEVYLENIVSTRYRRAGFYFNNSTVNILRGCVAHRIYDFNSLSQRITETNSLRKLTINFDTSNGYMKQEESAGLVANNSVVTLSSTHEHEYPLMREALNYLHEPLIPSCYIIEFSRNTNGMILNNSVLQGGKSEQDVSGDVHRSVFETTIDFCENVNDGLRSNNSLISLNGSVRFIENNVGINLYNSVFEYEKSYYWLNQKVGLNASNSKILYNKNNNRFHASGSLYDLFVHPNEFIYNGQHLVLDKSTMKPFMASSMEENYGRFAFYDALGIENVASLTPGVKSAITITNNSDAVLLSPTILRRIEKFVSVTPNTTAASIGSEILVNKNSTLQIRGTKYYCTKIIGPGQYSYNKDLAAVCADHNSTIFIDGPTVISQFGIDILANNNSKIQISPPQSNSDCRVDVSSIDLTDSKNHTSVELHSTRACIVVNNNSTLNLRDLGYYDNNYKNSYPLGVTVTATDYTDYKVAEVSKYLFTSGGSLQFYPNSIQIIGAINGPNDSVTGIYNGESFTQNTAGRVNYYYLNPYTTSPLDFSSITDGGMCVRAVNNSNIDILNVNFPCGFWNPSAPYHDADATFNSGGACNRLFIWNLADSSQLKSSLVSVSSMHPVDAGYRGPFGYWGSGTNGLRAVSGLPSSTPDTSTLSVLDFYGQNPSATQYSYSVPKNYGPFRLYFSVDSMINALSSADGWDIGINKQIYAQGYQSSSNLICHPSVSATYLKVLKMNNNVISPSGYYYNNEILYNPYQIRVWLDEISSNLFANSKHCSARKSNVANVVSINYPTTDQNYGESTNSNGVGSLIFFDPERII